MKLIVFGVILWCSLFGNYSWAQKVDTTKVYNIDEVVVSAKRVQKEVIPVQTMEGPVLQRLTVHSVADALRYFSGVQIKDYGGIGGLKTVNIRAMGTKHVGVFYDGPWIWDVFLWITWRRFLCITGNGVPYSSLPKILARLGLFT